MSNQEIKILDVLENKMCYKMGWVSTSDGMYIKKNWKTYDCQNKIYGNQAPLLGCQLLLARMRSYLGHRVSWKYKSVISFPESISNWLKWLTEIKYLKILSSFSPFFLGLNYAGLLTGNYIETGRSTGSDYCAALCWLRENQNKQP